MFRRSRKVIVCLQGGLGNQLYQYAVGRSLSRRWQCPLLFDLRAIRGDDKRNYELQRFCIQGREASFLDRCVLRWYTSRRFGAFWQRICEVLWDWSCVNESGVSYLPVERCGHHRAVVLRGYWQSYKNFVECESVIREDLEFRNSANEVNQRFSSEIEETESVAVHVRRGDYYSDPVVRATLGTLELEYYRRAASFVVTRVANPRFFVFTDDPIWAKANLGFLPAAKVVDHNRGAGHEDLRLMTRCKHFVIANSSFSWWGAWLGRHSTKIVVAPRRWFVSHAEALDDRLPPEWVQL